MQTLRDLPGIRFEILPPSSGRDGVREQLLAPSKRLGRRRHEAICLHRVVNVVGAKANSCARRPTMRRCR